MESTQNKLYEIEESAAKTDDVYRVADVDNIDYPSENQKLKLSLLDLRRGITKPSRASLDTNEVHVRALS